MNVDSGTEAGVVRDDDPLLGAPATRALLDALHEGWFATTADGTIVDANTEFCRIVGYRRSDVVGASPPYPWWPAEGVERAALEDAFDHILSTGGGAFDDVVVVRRDGARRTVALSMTTIHDASGPTRASRFGTVHDVTDARHDARERERLLATVAAERDRVRRMQAATAALAAAATRAEVTDAVLAHGMRAFGATASVVMVVARDGHALELAGLFGYRPEMFRSLQTLPLDDHSPLAAAVRSRRRVELPDLREQLGARPELEVVVREIGSAGVVIPMLLHDRAVGVVGVAFADDRALRADTLDDLEALARLAAQAFDRVRLGELDREIAHVLQHSLLPDALPEPREVELASRYLTAVADTAVGGDWYDVVALGDGRLGLAVGDVVGRGVPAATTMGQLRSALRALALVHADPAQVLDDLDRFARAAGDQAMATVVYVVFDPAHQTLRYACAGHPPPLVHHDGRARFLAEGRSSPIGAGVGDERRCATAPFAPGDVLVLYSDGLVERRGASIDEGLARLRAVVATGARDDVRTLADAIVASRPDGSPDDIAVLVARFTVVPPDDFVRRGAAEPGEVAAIRRDLQRWLSRHAPTFASEVAVAVGEACANVIEHAYVDDATGLVEVHACIEGDDVVVHVRDEGRWRTPHGDRDGRGLPLLESLMDVVDVRPSEHGTIVTMRRRRAAAPRSSGRARRTRRPT